MLSEFFCYSPQCNQPQHKVQHNPINHFAKAPEKFLVNPTTAAREYQTPQLFLLQIFYRYPIFQKSIFIHKYLMTHGKKLEKGKN
jgi:hypothetical protein